MILNQLGVAAAMGVPGFYSWYTYNQLRLIKRYPMVKHMIDKHELPAIDYLYLDMNGIIYKCVKDDSIIFKSQVRPKELEEIWLNVFNYINMIVSILKPNKMIVMALDGVAPRSKMNNQRARRFRSSRDYKRMMQKFYDYHEGSDSQENFKNNSISPGTEFMQQLNKNLDFFIKKKIEEDDHWKNLSVIFTGSDVPGEGEHKIMEFIRANKAQFDPEDTHCLYGADADLIMLSMTLPLKNLCIIREQYVPAGANVKIIESKRQKSINFEMIFITILKEYFQLEYKQLTTSMRMEFQLQRIIADFVFLFFFIGNDFLPRCMAYNIREKSVEDLIDSFKQFLVQTTEHIVGVDDLNIYALTLLTSFIARYELKFISEKGEQMEKASESKVEIESELSRLMKQKTSQDKQFLLELKASLMNQDQIKYKSLYYTQKFQIEPLTQVEEFYQILFYYLYGLKFVYEYYFIGLPSWQWYYPYYYAPLLSDLSTYLQFLSANGAKLEKINPGLPSEPFKQLMCILPKQSCELLPAAFHHYILDESSILRSPYDFYPDEFEDDPYGSIRAHQAISLIPFLDLNKINKAYNEAIRQVPQAELQRNEFHCSILYEFNEQQTEQIVIQSDFQSVEVVRCSLRISHVNLTDRFEWKKRQTAGKRIAQKFLRMPTLKIREFDFSPPSALQKSYMIQIGSKEEDYSKFKLGKEVFYGYPLEHSGKIQAILTEKGFICINTFLPYNYELDLIFKHNDFLNVKNLQKHHQQAFKGIRQDILQYYKKSMKWNSTKSYFFVADAMSFVRCLDGSFRRVYVGNKPATYNIVPAELLTSTRKYENTRDNVFFKNLKQEFNLDQYVLVFPGNSNNTETVCKGVVVGHNQANSLVRVRVTEKIVKIKQSKLQNYIHTRELFFTLKFTAFLVGTKTSILLTLLDSISIETECSAELPKSLDIGLNFISRREKKLVSNLVRVNFYQTGNEKYVDPEDIDIQKSFNKLEISLRGVELIIEYKQKFPQVFKFIESRNEELIERKNEKGKINWRESMLLSSLYKQPDLQQSAKLLMNVYIWLIKKQETHMPLSSIFSKQVATKNIEKMQEIFHAERKEKRKQYAEQKVIEVDPNYLFSRRLADIGSFHLALDAHSKGPLCHTIRDQVVCLKPEFFGHFGIVVGVDDGKYEVLFKKPSFGKSNLNGLCKELWGGKFFERELYNFDLWPAHLHRRQHQFQKGREHTDKFGYIGHHQIKVSKYKQKAVNTLSDIDKLIKISNKQIFSQEFLQYVREVRETEKVQKIEPQYQIVDPKGKYEHKYDKGSFVDKQYVEKMWKGKKYVQKPISEAVEEFDTLHDNCDQQIIENKLEAEAEEDTSVQAVQAKELDDEDDEEEDDILMTAAN